MGAGGRGDGATQNSHLLKRVSDWGGEEVGASGAKSGLARDLLSLLVSSSSSCLNGERGT
jgi:hypothetical protein